MKKDKVRLIIIILTLLIGSGVGVAAGELVYKAVVGYVILQDEINDLNGNFTTFRKESLDTFDAMEKALHKIAININILDTRQQNLTHNLTQNKNRYN